LAKRSTLPRHRHDSAGEIRELQASIWSLCPASRESGRKLVERALSLSFRAVMGTNDRVELEVAF
jgi:hypothetical protein